VLKASAPKAPFDPRLVGGAGFDISPDGWRFLLANSLDDTGQKPMTVIVNWTALAKK
jgi:hypothetical protein